MNIIINDAEARDIEALVAIENSCFPTDRLSRRSFSQSLRNPPKVNVKLEAPPDRISKSERVF